MSKSTRICQSGTILNLHNNIKNDTIMQANCQSSYIIYCLECNLCSTNYVGETRNRIIDWFQGHLFDLKHNVSTTVTRHFASHNLTSNPEFTVCMLKYIKLPKSIPRSSSIRNTREIALIHRLNTLRPNGLNILDWGVEFSGSQRLQHIAPYIWD